MKLLALLVLSQLDGGVPQDTPRIVRLTDDRYEWNSAAVQQVDQELKRLQVIEKEHRSESWVTVLLVGMAVGLVVGIPTGVAVTKLTQK